MATFVTESATARSPDETFDFICDLANWPLFPGYGPIPAIVEASLPPGESIGRGSRVRVRNSDGSVHHEVVVAFEHGKRFAVRMELGPPGSYLMRCIEETVDLEAIAGGTRVRRQFTTVPRSFLTAPLVSLVSMLLRKAVESHDAVMVTALAGARG